MKKLLVVSLVTGLLIVGCSQNSPAEIDDLIHVDAPLPNVTISSPVTISGEARGLWFFEASAPVKLLDADGNNLHLNPPYIQTHEWMTENFVPFANLHMFDNPTTKTGMLILEKDNPSGEAVHAESLSIPVSF